MLPQKDIIQQNHQIVAYVLFNGYNGKVARVKVHTT